MQGVGGDQREHFEDVPRKDVLVPSLYPFSSHENNKNKLFSVLKRSVLLYSSPISNRKYSLSAAMLKMMINAMLTS